MGFEERTIQVKLVELRPLKLIPDEVRKSAKYKQISASIAEIGLVEPPVVARSREEIGKFLLLDGHLRVEVLREQGVTEVCCLISTDDEAFTYNKRVNRIAIIQEHRMILKAIENGVSEERIARSLNVDIGSIRRRRKLLDGICAEAADLLKEKHIALNTFSELKKLGPIRQSRPPN
jgi:ParB-like chromosome segregation protein Spo0J